MVNLKTNSTFVYRDEGSERVVVYLEKSNNHQQGYNHPMKVTHANYRHASQERVGLCLRAAQDGTRIQ